MPGVGARRSSAGLELQSISVAGMFSPTRKSAVHEPGNQSRAGMSISESAPPAWNHFPESGNDSEQLAAQSNVAGRARRARRACQTHRGRRPRGQCGRSGRPRCAFTVSLEPPAVRPGRSTAPRVSPSASESFPDSGQRGPSPGPDFRPFKLTGGNMPATEIDCQWNSSLPSRSPTPGIGSRPGTLGFTGTQADRNSRESLGLSARAQS